MSDTMRLKEILEYHGKGWMTDNDVIRNLVFLAAKTPPETFVSKVPTEFQAGLREEANQPPQRPEEIEFLDSHVSRQYETEAAAAAAARRDAENRKRAQREYFDGCWALHHYFKSASR